MRTFHPIVAVLLLSLLAFTPQVANDDIDDPILGFSEAGSATQRALESDFERHLTPENLRVWMKKITARPHHVGSAYTGEKVKYMANLFESWGYDVEIEEFTVLFPTPRIRVVELVAPTQFKAKLTLPELDKSLSALAKKEVLPGYNAYSADGDVTAELVYVNQGIPQDYEDLERLGIDVKGKIVIARYGGSWRGIDGARPAAALGIPRTGLRGRSTRD